MGTVAHKYHGKTFFLTAKLSFSRQNSLSHGKTLFLTAKLSFLRQNSLFSRQNSLFSRQNFLFHDKTFFFTVKLFFMAKRSFVEYNIRSEENTCSESEEKDRYIWLIREIHGVSFAKHFPPGDHPESTYV